MSAARPFHAPMTRFPAVDDCLHIGGVALTELARRVGQTPLYAYDRKLITQRVELLHKHLPPAIQLYYAIKANPTPALVQHRAALVDGLEVASGGELAVALASGMEIAGAEVGELIVVFQSGAYGLTARVHAFLGHPAPAELLI